VHALQLGSDEAKLWTVPLLVSVDGAPATLELMQTKRHTLAAPHRRFVKLNASQQALTRARTHCARPLPRACRLAPNVPRAAAICAHDTRCMLQVVRRMHFRPPA
jgi:hypothetical protein